MRTAPQQTPALGPDAAHNSAALSAALGAGPGIVAIPAGRFPLAAALVLSDDQEVAGCRGPDGRPASRLYPSDDRSDPLVHVLGSRTAVRDLALEVPATRLGAHDGDAGTAVTVGRYLYSTPAEWISDIVLEGIDVERPAAGGASGGPGGTLPANSIAVMGAVRDVRVLDVRVGGGGTGLAVHWGAVGANVAEIGGPSYHPHRLHVSRLDVRNAFEGFYLSAVHDVVVEGALLNDVEIGFRLLAGDNTVRFATAAERAAVNSNISVTGTQVSWNGHLYAMRVAGWGRSEVDGAVTTLAWRDVLIRDCVVRTLPTTAGPGARPRAAIVLEEALGVALQDIVLEGTEAVDVMRTDGTAAVRVDAAVGPPR